MPGINKPKSQGSAPSLTQLRTGLSDGLSGLRPSPLGLPPPGTSLRGPGPLGIHDPGLPAYPRHVPPPRSCAIRSTEHLTGLIFLVDVVVNILSLNRHLCWPHCARSWLPGPRKPGFDRWVDFLSSNCEHIIVKLPIRINLDVNHGVIHVASSL